MKKLTDFLGQIYSKDGFSFKKSVILPWVGTELELVIFVICKNPARISLTFEAGRGRIVFDENAPVVRIPRFSIGTTIKAIDFTEESAIIRLSGFPDLEYKF